MTSLAVLVPVLARPERVAPTVASLYDSLADELLAGWEIRLVFVCSADDRAELAAIREAGLEPLLTGRAMTARCQYAKAINQAAALASEEWLFLGADDLHWHPGWLTAALELHAETGALVVGTNDLGNPTVMRGLHATHSLVHRDYLKQGTIDQPGKLLHDGYDHNGVDVEFVETAKRRGQFAFAAGSHVEHLHRLWGKAPHDATYAKGMRNAYLDRRLLMRRRRLWNGARPVASRRGRVSSSSPRTWP